MRNYHEQVEGKSTEKVLLTYLLPGHINQLSSFIDRLQKEVNDDIEYKYNLKDDDRHDLRHLEVLLVLVRQIRVIEAHVDLRTIFYLLERDVKR